MSSFLNSIIGFVKNGFSLEKREKIKNDSEAFLGGLFMLVGEHAKEKTEAYLEKWRESYEQAKEMKVPREDPIYSRVEDFILQYERLVRAQKGKCHEEEVQKYLEKERVSAEAREEKRRCAEMFANIDGKSLDDQQQAAVVNNTDRTLVLAGAGSGKTLTIAAKVKYLCEVKKVSPEKILLIAFTRKSAEEMTERIGNRLGLPVKATTFHKLGLDIITEAEQRRPDVVDSLAEFVVEYFEKNLMDDMEAVERLLMFFAHYLHIPADLEKEGSLGNAYKKERQQDMETLLSKYSSAKIIEKEEEQRRDLKMTLGGQYVKSLEELSIANFLFLNGIKYEYEALYPFESPDKKRKSYRPDFFLPEYNIYIEHFGVNRDGNAPWLSDVEGKKYQEDMAWKKNFHKENGTVLIESYSYLTRENRLLSELKRNLENRGVKFNPCDFAEVFKSIYIREGEKYFGEFIDLCTTFITLFKANDYSYLYVEHLADEKNKNNDAFTKERTRLFLEIIKPIIRGYASWLDEKKAIDFADMINMAADIIERQGSTKQYEWVIVDEFQDISVARARLLKAILKSTGAKLMCVGDDWQSIYRFAGSDIRIMTDFAGQFGSANTIRLERTYRNSQELIDSASAFILKNPDQLRKRLKSSKRIDYPISIFFYNENPFGMLEKALEKIIKDFGEDASILILGRTNYDFEIIKQSKLFEVKGNQKIVYRKHPRVPVSFMTIHRAKGLEADNVILLNFRSAKLGFPSLISDDPVLSLVLMDMEKYPYAEERRLMYVALTRTRNRTFILADEERTSVFYDDFEGDRNVFSLQQKSASREKQISCPKCKSGSLLVRVNEKSNRRFVGCSNFPRCDYTYYDPTVMNNPKLCPACGGFMQKRTSKNGYGFYGCSNYPICKHTEPLSREHVH